MKKKIFILFLIILTLSSCKSKSENVISKDFEYNSMDNPNYANAQRDIAFNDDGIYLVIDENLYYKEKSENNFVFLEPLSYVDDKPKTSDGGMKSYRETFSGESIVYYDNHIYFVTEYSDIEGSVKYFLNRVDKSGNNKERILEIKYLPYNLLINKGNIIMTELVTSEISRIHIYSNNFDEKTYEGKGYIGNIYPVENGFLFDEGQSEDGKYIEHLNKIDFDGKVKEIDKLNGNFVFATDKYYVTCSYIDGDPENNIHYIKDYEGNTIVEEKDLKIRFVDEKYYYTQTKDKIQKYGRYNLDKTLDSEIVPSEHLDNLGRSLFNRGTDFDSIVRVIGDSIISYQISDKTGYPVYFMGSFKTGEFTVLSNEYLDNHMG